MTEKEPRRVFLSYSYKDRQNPRLREILDQLTDRHGAQFWLWEDELLPGDSMITAVSDQINRATSVLIVVSRDSVTSGFGGVEWRIAQARAEARMLPTVVALRLDDVKTPELLAHLNIFDAQSNLEDLVPRWLKRCPSWSTTGWRVRRHGTSNGGTILTVSADVGARLVERYRHNPETLTTMDRREFEELVAEIFDRFGSP